MCRPRLPPNRPSQGPSSSPSRSFLDALLFFFLGSSDLQFMPEIKSDWGCGITDQSPFADTFLVAMRRTVGGGPATNSKAPTS